MGAAKVHHACAAPGPDPEDNFERLRVWADTAAQAGASLLLTPELFVTAEAGTGSAILRERLRGVAATSGVGLVASTVEATGDRIFVGAHWWDAHGALVAHTRKRHLADWQVARGFCGWEGAPPIIPEAVYSVSGVDSPVALLFSADARDPSVGYYLRDHGVRTLLVLNEAGTCEAAVVPAGQWSAKNTGVPFPQSGPLPEALLRPLPRIPDSWWSGPEPTHPSDIGS
ncbi:nitrilase-related carbon-nitrogen hydrolase [Arthrobacter sp. AOP36-A1-22]|uniref:nitrilase-related carbon-nitrogen hydrolase n=1 Tax=Arthrobacter sp. AOP36-A1-22 TaxID=3457684 RepID=UPI00264E459B|nr:hypothetical protein [Micrococcaceae bacterium]MDN5812218.1 hypothetical protein [Micrococcaceae bacterium]MDN5879614.1 hypothetical protein [Micrococcaceae bacterium]MDN6168716.1 hypothetical protein [Micrococcaceae bacterium]